MKSKSSVVFPSLILLLAMLACNLPAGLINVAEEVLTPLVLYVAISGNDANDCLGPESERACLTLQAALDKSTLNSAIHIGPGQFYVSEDPLSLEEPVYDLINGVTLIGAGQDQTIFHSYKGAYTFGVSGSIPVVIRNLGIDASNGAAGGINVRGRGDISIENCRVFYGLVGVLVQGNGVAKMTNSLIEKNQTGIQVLGGDALVWNDSVISENGTGISISNGGASADIMSSVIEKNVIGILNDGYLDMVDTMLQHNTTEALGNGRSGDAAVAGSTFDSNGYLDVRPSDGRRSTNATISNAGEMVISNSTISNNYGQAVLNDAEHIPQNDSSGNPIFTYEMTLDGVQIIGNGNAHLTPCAIVNTRGFLNVRHSNIQDNECVGVDVYGGEVRISQSSIIDNKVGLFVRGGSVFVTNTTISWNYWFGIEQVDDGHLELVNVTVVSNRGVEISSSNPDTNLVVRDTVIDRGCNAAMTDRDDFVCNESWIETTLGFSRLTEGGGTWFLPLLPGSPLIDAGVLCSVDNDQRGLTRPFGVACDVGAYESHSSTVIAPLEFVTPSGGVPGVIPLYTDTPQAPALILPLTPTDIPGSVQLTLDKNANCRRGPGTVYSVLTSVPAGETVELTARNEGNTWWFTVLPGNYPCWISMVAGKPNGNTNQLPVKQAPPTPIPTAEIIQCSNYADASSCTSNGCAWDKQKNSCH
ncbi:MAG: choice-of-anchor Q domain-containing protein [bacterium]|jgi:hypothetical protein|nr:choice-of-anchor Q domain-containing protein [bacterium]